MELLRHGRHDDEIGGRALYRKTYDFPGVLLNNQHVALAMARRNYQDMIEIGIKGWLFPIDALKLYELAYFCDGDVLEIGTGYGLSTSICAQACEQAGTPSRIVSIDIRAEAQEEAKAVLFDRPGFDRIEFMAGEAASVVETLIEFGRKFGFCFVDHDTDYGLWPVISVCRRLPGALHAGAFVLFHDYIDPRRDNKLRQAVMRGGLFKSNFEFWGAYGCSGLFRMTG